MKANSLRPGYPDRHWGILRAAFLPGMCGKILMSKGPMSWLGRQLKMLTSSMSISPLERLPELERLSATLELKALPPRRPPPMVHSDHTPRFKSFKRDLTTKLIRVSCSHNKGKRGKRPIIRLISALGGPLVLSWRRERWPK